MELISKTIVKHVENIFVKLEVNNFAEAVTKGF